MQRANHTEATTAMDLLPIWSFYKPVRPHDDLIRGTASGLRNHRIGTAGLDCMLGLVMLADRPDRLSELQYRSGK
jgi:hypothetical protein